MKMKTLFKKTVNNINNSIKNTFSSRHHSKDFIFARSEYLRTRLTTICFLFIVLTPFWAIFDYFLLPEEVLDSILIARVVIFIGLLLTLWISKKPNRTARKNLFLSGLTLALPAFFYAIVLVNLYSSSPQLLIGYSFIPFLLVGMLSIFPFTLIESLILGMGLLLLQFFSGFITESPFGAQSLQNIWLLFALLCVVMTSNHFHLSLLLRLYRQATHDPLTGLLNRVALDRHTEQIEKLVPRPSTAVVLLDLDKFKNINDVYGHSIGDQVLMAFASLLKDEAKDSEMICRYGGEEFLIIMIDVSKDEAIANAENIRTITEKLIVHNLEGMPFHISVSQGLSMLRADETIKDAIKRADNRLYEAKAKGRNCVVAADK